ncbi:lipid-binding SYLF domain-containing protein [Aequorivita marisscotiae]|uniref:Lipid-binding SYLF domain-containing protein n=1 Tax=Aequorivita marisscotiae TaxID=3040348 RepID=A0ABY8KVC3_9FLAO|nr:lipid-binding SYLF domain-containing protein [Aequorivita sp. Ant34-E75]WGF93374.1 lipid-binding SYLF domain-containing protein [Aequorivita sp. Ant34-E75]
MKTKNLFTIVMLFIGAYIFAQNAEDKKIIRDAEQSKAAFIEANPKMQDYFDDAKAYAIFPNVGKGAIIIGAASGNGAVYERGVLVGMANMKQLDIGAQIGGKAYSEVIFFKTDKAVQKFMDDDFQFGSNVSAIAVDHAPPSLDISYNDGVAVFTLQKEGLMAEVSVGGQRFDFEEFD